MLKSKTELLKKIERLESLNPNGWSNEFEDWESYCNMIDKQEALLNQNKEFIELIEQLQKIGHDGKEKIYYINAEELKDKLIGEKQ